MKKQMLKNILVLTLTTLLMGVLIGAAYFITAPIIKKNRDIKVIKVAQELYVDGDKFYRVEDIPSDYKKPDAGSLSSEELTKLSDYLFVFDKDKNYLGLIVISSGKGFSSEGITIAVAINKGDLIQSIKEVEFTETPGIGDKALTEFKSKYSNSALDYRPDVVAGSTVTSNALNQIIDQVTSDYSANKPALEKIVLFEEIVIDPLTNIFGEIQESTDSAFVPTEVLLERKVITGTKLSGVAYVAIKTYAFDNASGEVKVKVYLDKDGVIKHYLFETYEHSGGNFQSKVEAYLNAFINTNIKDVEATIAENAALKAGVTETTTNVIDPILMALKDAEDPLFAIFGKYTKVKNDAYTPREVVIEHYNYTGEKATGYSFVANKAHKFDTGYSEVDGNIKLEIIVSDDKIVKYEVLEYNHTAGNYKNSVLAYLDKFIGTSVVNISETISLNKGLYAGSTESGQNTVDVILLAIEVEASK